MAHKEQIAFCTQVRRRFPERFLDVRVLDVGSLDVNGNNRYLFEPGRYEYTGVDLGPGPNVDVVCPIHLYEAPAGTFDVVVSTEAFEHDRHLPLSLRRMVELLRPGGLLLFTCATEGRPEHGTRATSPPDSPFTPEFYRNVTSRDVWAAVDVDVVFSRYEFCGHAGTHDLRFWGLKREDAPQLEGGGHADRDERQADDEARSSG